VIKDGEMSPESNHHNWVTWLGLYSCWASPYDWSALRTGAQSVIPSIVEMAYRSFRLKMQEAIVA